MIRFHGRGLLLDVEGTTSAVSFVHDTLFPFARRELPDFLRRRGAEAPVAAALERLARDAGAASLADWVGAGASPEAVREHVLAEVNRLMDRDAKATGLKELQGLVWQEGYAAWRLRSHVYPDVPPALRRWRDAGRDVRIYSSGSVTAQKVFFAHTEAGDLLPLLNGHYDTTVGGKREPDSYRRILADMGLAPELVLFLSDVPAELDAAAAAGLHTGLVLRPGNAPVPDDTRHPTLRDFGEIVD